jgi:hypothetical protein
MKSEGGLLKRWHETISGHMTQLPLWRRRRRMMKKTFLSGSAILLS